MDEKSKKYCPNCSQAYHLKSPTNMKANIPLFLECGHSMCESCVRNIVKFEEPIECKVCHRDMKVSSSDVALLAINKDKIYEIFPVNLFLLGELTFHLMEETCKPLKQEMNCYVDLHAILKNTDLTKGECLECHNQTSKMCTQCETVLCDSCFTKTHKNFIIFQNHVLQNIEPKIESDKCKTHKGKPLDYYCKDCCKAICMDCLMVGGDKSCKNHNVVSMDEVNETFVEELTQYAPKLDENFRRLSKTAVTIGNLLYNIEHETAGSSDLTQVLASIEQYFSKLAYAIQKHKEEVIDIVVKLKTSEKESLRKAKDEIANSLKKTKSILSTLNLSMDPKKIRKINFAVLLDEAKQIAESPWYLSKDESNDPLKVAVNEDLCTLINDYIHLEGNANSVYKLRSTKEIPEGVELPPAPPSLVYPPELPKDVRQKNAAVDLKVSKPTAPPVFCKNVPKYRSKSGSVSSVNSADSESSISNAIAMYGEMYSKPVVQQVQPFAESQHPKQLHEGSQELIYISHIVNPHNFYVQRACHQNLVKEMLREFKNANKLPKPAIKHVTEGKTLLVYNKTDNMWQRCRVMSIDRRDPNNPLFHVFCIDFGSTEIANIDKLRLLPPARVQSPYPLATNCSLANCRPRTGAWATEDAYLINNIIDNKQAIIHVRQIRATSECTVTLDCDVITFEEGISLAHALVFHERAVLINPKLSYPRINRIMERPKLFLSNSDFKHKSTEQVYITHIVSPDKFYVRKSHLQNVFTKLCEDLEQEYSLSVKSGIVYLPEIGMVCAVQADVVGADCPWRWWRGVVRALPGRARVALLLPDLGVEIVAHFTHLRHIAPKFCAHAALATECYLAGVTPVHKMWSPGSVALLRHFQDKLLEIHVEDTRRGSIGVTLIDSNDPDDVVCVNTEMIKHKFAITFGLFTFNKNACVEDQVITNKSPLDVPKVNSKQKTKAITMLAKNNTVEIAKKIATDDELEAKDKGPLRLEAKILNYQSPSLIYVSLVHQQKVFKELFEKMQKYYANKVTQEQSDWAVGDRCATLCDQSKTWRRAVIIEIENNNAKVFYSDFAFIEILPISSLKELTPEFMVIGDAAIKCHLSGVSSADGEDWPTITKEFLKELLDAYQRVFITKMGNFKDKSMPVELWVYHTIQGGPLEPNKSEWRCLNKKIIEQGLAVPDKNQPISSAEHGGVDGDMLAFLKNVTGSVGDYLQLEPMPTTPLVTKQNVKSPKSEPTSEDEEPSSNANDNPGTMFISDWLPPEPLQCKEFTGMPTYIDNDGIIYLHDITQQDTLDLIRKALDVRFKDPEPKAKYTKWHVGEPCVARFFLDDRFYRGRIVEVNADNSTCVVHYVDYGNEEACSFENLRKSLALYQIPTQAHKCVLSRILPVEGKWNRQALDYIHKFIVEKQCFIKVVGEPRDGIIPIDLKYDKLWLNDHLVDFELAVYADGSKPIVPKYLPITEKKTRDTEPIIIESDSGPDYIVEDDDTLSTNESFNMKCLEGKDWIKLMEEDDENIEEKFVTFGKCDQKEFLCNITIINDFKKLELSIIHDDETKKLYEMMFEEIQRESEKLPPLDGVFENKACIALFHEDGQWYRAVILQFSEDDGRVKVRYVDYGNIEVIKITDIREIAEEWTHLPPATLTVALHGVQINSEMEIDVVTKEYANVFLDKGPFYAKIINDDDSLPTVELRNDEGELIYADMINNNILLKYSDSQLVD